MLLRSSSLNSSYILSIITLDWSSFKEAKFISRHFQHLTSVFLMTIFKDWISDWINGSDGLRTSHISGPTSELFQQLRVSQTARLRTPAVTFTNSRPVAARRGKQAVTKTNEGRRWGWRACAEVGWTSLSISERHGLDGPPAIYLTAGGWEADVPDPACDESVCVRVCQLSPFR